MTDRGILYVASREPYLSEAAQSARSIRKHHPDISITIDAPADADLAAVFDEVRSLDGASHDFSDSNLTGEQLPYDRTLFLDTDTYVTGALDDVFAVLDRAEIAAAHDPTRTGSVDHETGGNVPETWPQYNTGVLGLKRCVRVDRLLNRWNRLYETIDAKHNLNQPAFRIALYESDIEIATLPPEYNFRLGNVANSVLYACGPVRILHGRSMHWTLPEIAHTINADTGRRVIVAKPQPRVIPDDDRDVEATVSYAADRAQWAYRKDGAVSAMLTLGSMVKDRVVRS